MNAKRLSRKPESWNCRWTFSICAIVVGAVSRRPRRRRQPAITAYLVRRAEQDQSRHKQDRQSFLRHCLVRGCIYLSHEKGQSNVSSFYLAISPYDLLVQVCEMSWLISLRNNLAHLVLMFPDQTGHCRRMEVSFAP